MGDLLLGIDVGTASTKGVLLRPDGSAVADARAEHGMAVPRPGWAEQDADAVWWADVVAVARRLTDAAPSGDRIAAVACSAIGPTLLPLDDGGRPLRPGILYGVDTRATDQIAALEARHGAADLTAFSGHALSSQAVGPKIAWLREHEPAVFERSRWLVTASSYLGYRLTGALAIDAHTASHWNPLFDPRSVAWSDRFADGLCELDRLAPIGWPADVLGELSPVAAAETGLPAGIPVAVGTVDVQAEAWSVGVVDPGDLMIMYGSTTFFLLVTDTPMAADPLWLVAGGEPGRWQLAAGLATGGSAMAWFRDQFARDLVASQGAGGQDAFAALAAEAVASGAADDREALLFLPYLSGERTPINDPHARGIVAGLSLHATRGATYRALLEGIAYAARHNVETMAALGAPVRRAVAVGGGTADPFFLSLVSDATGLEQVVPADTIGAARGDAFVAGSASGLVRRDDLAGWVTTRHVVTPDPATRAGHDRRYARYRQLYEASRDVVHGLVRGD